MTHDSLSHPYFTIRDHITAIGTTGETLSILTNALGGMDHKLHIILNKGQHYSAGTGHNNATLICLIILIYTLDINSFSRSIQAHS